MLSILNDAKFGLSDYMRISFTTWQQHVWCYRYGT